MAQHFSRPRIPRIRLASGLAGSIRFRASAIILACSVLAAATVRAELQDRPHVFLLMADDMGWGQTGYYDHPLLETPHLNAMAENGLRFDRFYAGAPVCSPTRASVLTGRANDRTGVLQHGYALRLQERTLPEAMREAGYATGHFGKWHLNGLRGPGAPILADDPYGPGAFGFEEWVSVSNFFDLDPILSRRGEFEEFSGDSSEIIVDEALAFLEREIAEAGRPVFAVIWYGTPHSPFRALPEDHAPFAHLPEASAHQHGELVAMDRSVGTLRARLRELGVEENSLVFFCSDNGGLPPNQIEPDTVGGLRGHKGTVYEGGLRVPAVLEWPARVAPRVTDFPASTMDLFPTLVDVLGLPEDSLLQPVDGISLASHLDGKGAPETRETPIPFRFMRGLALVDNDYKLVRPTQGNEAETFALYHLANDPVESRDLSAEEPAIYERMKTQLLEWNDSVEASFAGADYPEQAVSPPDPEPVAWYETDLYREHHEVWRQRWEFQPYFERAERRRAEPEQGGTKGKGKGKGKGKSSDPR